MFVLYFCVSISALQISSSVPVFFLGGSGSKESAHNAGVLGSIPRLGRSPAEGNGYPLQYSCLENSMDRGPGGLQSAASQGVRHDWVTNTFTTYTTYKQYYTTYVFIFLTNFPLWQSLGLSTFLQMALFPSFLWLNNTPLYICVTSSLSIPLLMDIYVDYMSQIL